MNREKSSKSPPILIVDDNKNFLNSMEFFLHSKGLTNVDSCQDSREVMHLLEKKKYSLILLDLKMPHITGEELLPEIVERFPEIPVIILTGYKDTVKIVNCINYGAFDYVVKDSDRLLKVVQDSLYFIHLEENDVLKEFDFSNEKDAPSHSKALLKIDFLSRTGRAPLVIAKFAPVIENKKIDKANVNLFFVMGKAYEKIKNFVKAEDIYRAVEQFDPVYPEIQKKLENIEKLKEDIIKIYHRDRYDIIETVGEGGMGVVYKARDKKLKRTVALKILNQSAIKDQRDIERFFSEAEQIAKLRHTNIVEVYDCGQIENDYFISMEFIEGQTLETFFNKKNPIPIPDILVIAKKLLEALAHSHKNGVIHRDIKPRNIMITYDKEVKVVDFGVAVLRDELKKENRDAICGTPLYMSPEQFEDLPTDHRTDIYSTGVTLFHLVTGKIPFDGDKRLEIMIKHLDEPVPPIRKYRNDIPEKLIQIIEKCMAKKKEDRYQSASEVIEEIYEIKDESGNTIITEREKSELFGPQKETLPPSEDEGDTEKLDLNTAHFIKILNDEEQTIDIRKNAVNSLEQIGGSRAIDALKKVSTDANEQLAKAALYALKKLYELDLDKIDIPKLAYYLVLCRYASPELLIELNPVEFKKSIQEIYPGEKGDEYLVPALQIFEEKYSHQKPDPLWHSWITTIRCEQIKEVKKMFVEMINP